MTVESLVRATWFAPVMSAATITVIALLRPPSAARRPDSPGRRRRGHLVDRLGDRVDGARRLRASWRLRRPHAERNAGVDPSAIATWVDELARHLRRGATLRAALIEVSPADPALLEASHTFRQRLGRGALVSEAARDWHAEVDPGPRPSGPAPKGRGRGCRHLAAVATVLATAAEVGGGVGEPLDRLAAAMRQAAADDLERSAQSASARLSAQVLTFVPFAVLGLLLLVDREVRGVATSPTGGAVVSAGVALNLLGGAWMRRIIGGAG